MTDYRSKAQAIAERGTEERGEFDPEGKPAEIYNYWLQSTNSDHGKQVRRGMRRENFCHFWRVVLLWGPLMWFFNSVKTLAESKVFIGVSIVAVLGILVAIGSTFPTVGEALLTFGGVLLAIGWVVTGLVSTMGLYEPDEFHFGVSRNTLIAGAVLSPVASLMTLGLAWTADNWNDVKHLVQGACAVFVVLGMLFIAGLIIMDVGWLDFFIGIGFGVLIVLGVVLFLAAMSAIGDSLGGRRKARRIRAANARDEWLALHPDESPVVSESREPGRLSKFFTGVGDFLILLANIVKVNKWKICPLVNVDTVDRVEPNS